MQKLLLFIVLSLLLSISVLSHDAYATHQSCNSCSDCSTKLKNAGGHIVFLTSDISSGAYTCIDLSGSFSAELNCGGRTISNTGSSTVKIAGTSSGVSGITFKDCNFSGHEIIYVQDAALRVYDSSFSYSNTYAIRALDYSSLSISGNTFSSNRDDWAIALFEGSTGTINENTFNRGGINAHSTTNLLFIDNKVNKGRYGAYIQSSSGVTIRDNVEMCGAVEKDVKVEGSVVSGNGIRCSNSAGFTCSYVCPNDDTQNPNTGSVSFSTTSSYVRGSTSFSDPSFSSGPSSNPYDWGNGFQSSNSYQVNTAPNQQVCLYVRYQDYSGKIGNSGGGCKYSNAAIPDIRIDYVGTTTLSATVDPKGNPYGTEYEVRLYKDGSVIQTKPWSDSIYIEFTSLSPNEDYGVDVRARNGDGVTTGFSALRERYTLANPVKSLNILSNLSSEIDTSIDIPSLSSNNCIPSGIVPNSVNISGEYNQIVSAGIVYKDLVTNTPCENRVLTFATVFPDTFYNQGFENGIPAESYMHAMKYSSIGIPTDIWLNDGWKITDESYSGNKALITKKTYKANSYSFMYYLDLPIRGHLKFKYKFVNGSASDVFYLNIYNYLGYRTYYVNRSSNWNEYYQREDVGYLFSGEGGPAIIEFMYSGNGNGYIAIDDIEVVDTTIYNYTNEINNTIVAINETLDYVPVDRKLIDSIVEWVIGIVPGDEDIDPVLELANNTANNVVQIANNSLQPTLQYLEDEHGINVDDGLNIINSLIGSKYKRTIKVDNNQNSKSLIDYQVPIIIDTYTLVQQGKMQNDCDDLYFRDSDEMTPLNFWIEYGCNTGNTKIWVKIPYLHANSEKYVYVYYGNNNTESAGNPFATMMHYDDFSREYLYEHPSDIPAITYYTGDWYNEYARARSASVGNGQSSYLERYGINNIQSDVGIKVKFDYRLNSCGGNFSFKLNNQQYLYVIGSTQGLFEKEFGADDKYELQWRFGRSRYNSCYDYVYIDNLIIRKFSSPEPVTQVGGEEPNQIISLPLTDLVAKWEMNSNDHNNPVQGKSRDSGVGNYHLNLYNVDLVEGKYADGYLLNSNSDMLEFDKNILSGRPEGTIMYWFHPSGLSGEQYHVYARGNRGGLYVRTSYGYLEFEIYDYDSPQYNGKVSTSVDQLDGWTHLTYTWGPTGMYTYINGVPVSFNIGFTDGTPVIDYKSLFGTRSDGSYYYNGARGTFDSARVFSRQLNAAEISSILEIESQLNSTL